MGIFNEKDLTVDLQKEVAELQARVDYITQLYQNSIQMCEVANQKYEEIQHKNVETEKRLAETEQRLNEHDFQMNLLSAITAATREADTIEETIHILNSSGKEMLHAENLQVYRIDMRNPSTVFTAELNNREYIRKPIKPLEDSLMQQALSNGQTYIINDISANNYNIGDNADTKGISNAMLIPLQENGITYGVVIAKNKTENGEIVPFTKNDEQTFRKVYDQQFKTSLLSSEDKELAKQSQKDNLTQLPNRDTLDTFINNTIYNRVLHGEPCSAVMFDIDKFKNFNDSYGHLVGDDCLRTVAKALQDAVRSDDNRLLVRWGGEEIVAVLPVDEEKATIIADRLRKTIENIEFDVGNNEIVPINVSVGVSEFKPTDIVALTNDMNDKENGVCSVFLTECLEVADRALYISKGNGRNQVSNSHHVEDANHRTETFQKLLDNLEYEIVYSTDKDKKKMFDLVDKTANETVLVNTSFEAIRDYIGSSIEYNVLAPLYDKLSTNDYIPQDFDTSYAKDVSKWSTIIASDTRQLEASNPEYKSFVEANSDMLDIVRTLSYRTQEVDFASFAQMSELEKQKTLAARSTETLSTENDSKAAPPADKPAPAVEEDKKEQKKAKASIDRD